jgi:putative spermidine/putrescine transport system substrate-binding protein
LIETFDPADLPAVRDTLPKYRLAAPDGRLLGVPIYFTYYGIAVNTDLVKPGEITSWRDLGDPRWKGKLAYARPVYASIYDLTVCAYAEGGNERNVEPGVPLFRKLAGNALTAFNSLAQANQLLGRGEIAAAPYFASRIWAMKPEGLPVDMIIPKEGALILPYMAMVPKGAFDLDAAKSFLNFIIEPEPQSQITEITGYISLATNARLSPEHEKRLGMPLATLRTRLIEPDWTVLAEQQNKRADIVAQVAASAL